MSKVNQLQLLQQNVQSLMVQKQQLQTQQIELESALKELKNTNQAYKIVGKVMIASSKDDLTKDLQEKKEVLDLRLKSIAIQEKKVQESMEKLQQEVVEEMQKEKKEEDKAAPKEEQEAKSN